MSEQKLARHRIFGLTLADFFLGTRYEVEVEKDLSEQQQFVDVVVIERVKGKPVREFPDGLENLGAHNLLTYKSPHEPVDCWALDELLGHYVNYRKQTSAKRDPKLKSLLHEKDFRLYAVCTRVPRKLAKQTQLRPIKQGVYEVMWGCRSIRIIVLKQVPRIERNALWQIFSNIPEGVRFGARHYRWRNMEHSPIVNELFERYHVEVKPMPYTWDDFYVDKALERKDKVLARLPAKDRLKGLPPEEIEAYLNKLRKRNPQNKRKSRGQTA